MDKCLNCEKELEQIPKKRQKQFCNSTCRSNYWQKSKRIKNIEKLKYSPITPESYNCKKLNRAKYDEVSQFPEPKITLEEISPEKQKELSEGIKNITALYEAENFKDQINAIKAEKCPYERNTPLGKKSWEFDRQKRITELEKQLK